MFYRLVIKKYLDIFVSFITLILLLPLLIIIGFLNLFLNGSPIFFKQERPGYKGKLFTLIKFRTMDVETKEFKNDQKRLNNFGRFLRKTSLDELPSLFNVLKGELSFVGPRPLLKKYLGLYSAYQAKRHDVYPGLSGLAQIKGRNLLDWERKLDYDVRYVNNQSLILDLKIIILTFIIILKRKGISPIDNEIMPEFKPKSNK
tara:strand:+ start:289 stop:894 length:606 start_codon:yes stop_codon:yes gene_type:complete